MPITVKRARVTKANKLYTLDKGGPNLVELYLAGVEHDEIKTGDIIMLSRRGEVLVVQPQK